MTVLPNIKANGRQTFFAHYYRFIGDFFLPLLPDTSLTKRYIQSKRYFYLFNVDESNADSSN